MKRRDKINYYLDIAEAIAARSTCLRRHYGAIVVQNDQIISTGYSGAPRGRWSAASSHPASGPAGGLPAGRRAMW